MNNAPYEKSIEYVAQRTDICLLNNIEKARRFAEKPHCKDICLIKGQVTPSKKQLETATATNSKRSR